MRNSSFNRLPCIAQYTYTHTLDNGLILLQYCNNILLICFLSKKREKHHCYYIYCHYKTMRAGNNKNDIALML